MTIKDRVLVVEDEKSISGLIKAILTANGYDVITASTGNEAFSMISSHCPDLFQDLAANQHLLGRELQLL